MRILNILQYGSIWRLIQVLAVGGVQILYKIVILLQGLYKQQKNQGRLLEYTLVTICGIRLWVESIDVRILGNFLCGMLTMMVC
jgi:hypothetical protein